MLSVGLTGGIASGKSTVAALFEELGVPRIDADKISREVVAPHSEGLSAVTAAFGDQILDAQGALNRAALRTLIFADTEKRRELETILHPRIRARSDELAAKARAGGALYAVFEIPLLLETGRHRDMDQVLVVDVSTDTQIARVMARDGCDERQAQQILAAQSPRDARLAIADDVIHNESGLAELAQAVGLLHQKYSQLSAAT